MMAVGLKLVAYCKVKGTCSLQGNLLSKYIAERCKYLFVTVLSEGHASLHGNGEAFSRRPQFNANAPHV